MADAARQLDAWIKQVQQEGPVALQEALSPFKARFGNELRAM
jgi:hypothetical protein